MADRSDDAAKLLGAVGDPAVVPKHLRRRARSWRPFGLLRCRPPAMEDAHIVRRKKTRYRTVKATDSGSLGAAAVAAEQDQAASVVRVRVRKHWRRAATLLRIHSASAPPLGGCATRYLPSHVWHAKRAHMENLWKHRLAARNCNLGPRALYRATSRQCCMHDRSYMQLFELFGAESSLVEVLTRCGINKRLACTEEARAGSRRVRALLYALDSPRLIAPVQMLWSPHLCVRQLQQEQDPSSEEEILPFVVDVGVGHHGMSEADVPMSKEVEPSNQAVEKGWKLWIWVHPSAADEAHAPAAVVAPIICSVVQAFSSLSTAGCPVLICDAWLLGTGTVPVAGCRTGCRRGRAVGKLKFLMHAANVMCL